MIQQVSKVASPTGTGFEPGGLDPIAGYCADALRRDVLFLDVMRQRGKAYRMHPAETAPHVLNFDANGYR